MWTDLSQSWFADTVDVGLGTGLDLTGDGFVTNGTVDFGLHEYTRTTDQSQQAAQLKDWTSNTFSTEKEKVRLFYIPWCSWRDSCWCPRFLWDTVLLSCRSCDRCRSHHSLATDMEAEGINNLPPRSEDLSRAQGDVESPRAPKRPASALIRPIYIFKEMWNNRIVFSSLCPLFY